MRRQNAYAGCQALSDRYRGAVQAAGTEDRMIARPRGWRG
jgi:hypothetical protein